MKTNTNLISRLLLSCLLLFIFNFSAQAQGEWPYPGTQSPLLGAPATSTSLADDVDCGLLQNPDSQIWVKVNGNMAGPTPHNKMHNYVTAGSTVEVNFNVNKNRNRYTLVSYTIAPDGTRSIFDYQSNLYNNGSPVQGNSNQQKVLVPKNCDWEIYLIKGCLVSTFPALAPTVASAPTAGPSGNPYGSAILDYAYGSGTDLVNCEVCPVIANPSPMDQVYFRIIEVINDPITMEKKLVFSVINTTNTKNTTYNYIDYIGDVFFSNITPTHHPRNNTPYQFRYNYQAGPVITGYTVGTSPNIWYGPKNAFVFDQRNNHNNLNYATYQSELFMFSVTDAEFTRLSTLGAGDPKPEICAELSGKHPEPHKTLPPIFCSEIDFLDCGEVCTSEDSPLGNFTAQIPEYTSSGGIFTIPVTILNYTANGLTSVEIVAGNAPGTPVLSPTNGSTYNATYSYNVTNDNIKTVTFTGTNTANFKNGASDVFNIQVNANTFLNIVGAVLHITVTAGGITETFTLETGDCGIIGPLPVELTSFAGKAVSEGIALNWKTSSEKDNDRFEVERSSDGRNFEKIGTVKGNGTSNVAHSYSFLDKYAQAGVNYYRLNQVDFGGTNERSQIIKVSAEKAGTGLGVQLIPNPCQDQNCTVQLKNIDTSAPITVELRDLTGRLIFSQQVPADQNSFQLPRVDSGNGIYLLSARNGSYTAYQKIVIQ